MKKMTYKIVMAATCFGMMAGDVIAQEHGGRERGEGAQRREQTLHARDGGLQVVPRFRPRGRCKHARPRCQCEYVWGILILHVFKHLVKSDDEAIRDKMGLE